MDMPNEILKEIFSYLVVYDRDIHVDQTPAMVTDGPYATRYQFSFCWAKQDSEGVSRCACFRKSKPDLVDTSILMISKVLHAETSAFFFRNNRFYFRYLPDDSFRFVDSSEYAYHWIRHVVLQTVLLDNPREYDLRAVRNKLSFLARLESLHFEIILVVHTEDTEFFEDGLLSNLAPYATAKIKHVTLHVNMCYENDSRHLRTSIQNRFNEMFAPGATPFIPSTPPLLKSDSLYQSKD